MGTSKGLCTVYIIYVYTSVLYCLRGCAQERATQARISPRTHSWRNEPPMRLMMLAQGASIISIIGGSFFQSKVCQHPLQPAKIGAWTGQVFKTSVLMMLFRGVPADPQQFFRSGGFASKPHANFGLVLERGRGRPLGEAEVQ